jgi:hypothetical protein
MSKLQPTASRLLHDKPVSTKPQLSARVQISIAQKNAVVDEHLQFKYPEEERSERTKANTYLVRTGK